MRILIVNAGSSSLKLRVVGPTDEVVFSEDLPTPHGALDRDRVRDALGGAPEVDAVGHRIVHGGTEFVEPVLLDEAVVAGLRALTDLAPLHQPKSLAALDAVTAALPRLPGVACFDTAFHASLPAAASTYALPAEWRQRWSLRRFGFHGLSHAWAARRAAGLLGRSEKGLRLVTCHLGAGASLAAVQGGRSVDTTMGFTPLEGLVMATRSGSVDPGLVLWLEERVGTPPAELAATLEHRSGLLGLAGSDDMREVLAAAAETTPGSSAGHERDAPAIGSEEARLALDVYVHRLRAGIAAMAAAMAGVDGIVFTGGVGENSPEVRRLAVGGLGFLGLGLDGELNDAGAGDRDVSLAGSPVKTFVVESREDLEIASQVRRVLGTDQAAGSQRQCQVDA